MSVAVDVQLRDARIQRMLRRLLDRTGNLRPLMNEIGEELRSFVDEIFRNQRDPWGTPWVGHSAVTTALRPGGQILRDTGRLSNSVTYKATREDVTIGADVVYAATHQFGRASNRFPNTPRGAPAPIPARPFLPARASGVDLPPDWHAELEDLIFDYFEDVLDGD
jgi:phage virion morphogenesis protein